MKAVAIGMLVLPLGSALAQVQRRPAPPLVVVLVVDQMRSDYLDRFGPEFTGGLARLRRNGAVFTRAFQDHGLSETAPGHATILSGRYPVSTGIVSNDQGVPDSTTSLVGVGGLGASPIRFRGTALLDWVRARWPGSRMISVSRKDRGAILPVGRAREGVTVVWFAGGHFTTSTWYGDTLPGWVRRFDAAAAEAERPGRAWTLLREPAAYAEPDSQPWENRGRNVTFPHVQLSAAQVIEMPWMDSLLLALALDGVRAEQLGERRGEGGEGGPDILAISLSTLDAVGHMYGPGSREVHDHLLRLDGYLGAFLDSLDLRFGAGNVLVALTADHGVTPRPEWSRDQGQDAQFVRVGDVVDEVRADLAARLGPGAWLPYRDVGMIALDRAALAERGVDVDLLATTMAARLRALPGVARVDTRATLARGDTTRSDAVRRWRRVLAPGVPGEVFITLRPGYYMGNPLDAQHGQASDDDTHVALILAGPGVRAGVYRARRAAVVDLGPTLAALLGVAPIGRVDGRVLREALR